MRVRCVLKNAVDKNHNVLSPEAFVELVRRLDPRAEIEGDTAKVSIELPDETVETEPTALRPA